LNCANDHITAAYPNPLYLKPHVSGKNKTFGRAISAALHTPQLGGHAVTGGPKFQSRNNLAPQRKLRSPKLKYEAWEISKVGAPFQRNVHYSFFGPLWKQGIYTLQLLLGGPIESKVVHLYIAIAVGPLWKKGIYTLQLLLGGLLKAK